VNTLTEIGVDIANALANNKSQYRGLCKERYSLFRDDYGKTSLWQALIEKIQLLLTEKNRLFLMKRKKPLIAY